MASTDYVGGHIAELVWCYPHMAYQVDGACAVVGYIDLYSELDILSEVHIAEEARECGHMAIFDENHDQTS